MSQIVNEVTAANRNYAAAFGAKKDLALPPARRLCNPDMYGRAPRPRRNTRVFPRATRTSFVMPEDVRRTTLYVRS